MFLEERSCHVLFGERVVIFGGVDVGYRVANGDMCVRVDVAMESTYTSSVT